MEFNSVLANIIFYTYTSFEIFIFLPVHSSGFDKIVFHKGYLRPLVLRLRYLQHYVPLRTQLSASGPGWKQFYRIQSVRLQLTLIIPNPKTLAKSQNSLTFPVFPPPAI